MESEFPADGGEEVFQPIVSEEFAEKNSEKRKRIRKKKEPDD